LPLQQNPSLLQQKVKAHTGLKWIFIDEIQKLPELLDEVHSLIESSKGRYKFILTGSSARKIKRQGANLLVGRARTENLFALTAHEMKSDFNLEQSLLFGNLPMSVEK
jgi:uncharacterized protein